MGDVWRYIKPVHAVKQHQQRRLRHRQVSWDLKECTIYGNPFHHGHPNIMGI